MSENQEGTKQESFDASCLILGFTGSIGSGCTFLSEGIKSILAEKGHYYKLSDTLRTVASERRIDPTVENLQQLGDELRRLKRGNGEHWYSYLVEKCVETIKEEDGQTGFSGDVDTVIIIDGIKNTGEANFLRQFPNFYLISVHAEQDVRKKRLVGPQAYTSRFENDQEFFNADKRDEEEDVPWGQQIKKCNYLSDIIIDNNTDIPESRSRDRREFFNKFVSDYVYPMRKVREGEKAHDRPPEVKETLMTLAYCVSKRSSCLKRKVGAVIAYNRRLKDFNPDVGPQVPNSDRDLQFQVISTGYNDVPAGTPCVFTEYGKCYRDYLQEEHAKQFKKCPECGTDIPETIECSLCGEENEKATLICKNDSCKSDLLAEYECQNETCQTKIYSKFLPGKKDAPGKLLDMCRALHAEENAILGLSGISKPEKGELVLYTTTFPCNLCANKIISAGITKVYYAEPYTMKESKELLDKFKVKLELFQGIKSKAYFRLYT